MKSSRFIFIFVGVSLLLHFSLLLFNLEPEKVDIAIQQKKLIPVDLAIKQQDEPATPPNREPEPPEIEEVVPEPTLDSVPVSKPEPVTEPAPKPVPQPAEISPRTSSFEDSAVPTTPATDIASTGQISPQNENPFDGLLQRLNQYKKSTYPLSARKKGYQGTVLIKLILDKNGYMVSSEIIEKSSHSSLNSAALKLIDKIMETPYPHNLGKRVSLRLPISYKLD